MNAAAEREQYELAAKYRDLISTVELQESKQRIHAVDGDDADVFGYHYENQMLAVNLFHMRGGKIMDKREFFWEDMDELVGEQGFNPGELLLGASQAGLSRPAVHSAQHLCSGGRSKTARRWKRCCQRDRTGKCRFMFRNAATSARWWTWSDRTPSRPTISASG